MVGPGLAIDLGESIARLANVCFGSKADMCSALGDVRFVPKADIASMASYVFFLSFCCKRWWALMNLSAKRDDPPGTVAGTLLI